MAKIPFPYQEEAIAAGLSRNILNADECGTGKTLEAVEIILRGQASRQPWWQRPVLILTPKKVAAQWEQTIYEQSPGGYHPEVIIAGPGGDGIPSDLQYSREPIWIISHYENVARVPVLAKVMWSAIVCDEAHRIKNRQTKLYKSLKSLRAYRKIALTGTPIEKSPGDIWAPLHWLYPDRYPGYWSWHAKYVHEEPTYPGSPYLKIVGGKNQDQMWDEIKDISFRRTKKMVAPQLPALPPPHIIPVLMEPAQEAAYKALKKNRDLIFSRPPYPEMVVQNGLAKFTKLHQIASDPSLVSISAPSGKMEWLNEYLEDNADECVVVFTRYRATALAIAKKWDADVVVGGVPFQGFSKRICVGTIAAMGEGINLQRATTAIFFDQEFSSLKMQQAKDRIHRIDDLRAKSIIYLTTPNTVDRLVLECIEKKWSEIDLVNSFLESER